MDYEEAVGVGRVISVIQRKMLLNMGNWESGPATDWNQGELLWKRLIEPAQDNSVGFQLTDRGLAVKNALELKALSDAEVLAAVNAADGDNERIERLMLELEHRGLVT